MDWGIYSGKSTQPLSLEFYSDDVGIQTKDLEIFGKNLPPNKYGLGFCNQS